jgi:hypothetical protein
MELSPSREAANCAATQELLSILWNPEVHHRVQRPKTKHEQKKETNKHANKRQKKKQGNLCHNRQ